MDHIGSGSSKRSNQLEEMFTRLPKGGPRTISPTAISAAASCPLKHTLERVARSNYQAYVSSSANAYGTAVHKAMENALNFLRKEAGTKGFPGSSNIASMILEAQTVAEKFLKAHLALGKNALQRPNSFVKAAVKDWGEKYLATGGNAALLTELPIQTLGLPTGDQASGIMDALMYREGSDLVDVVDWKYARASAGEIGADYASVFDPATGKRVKDFKSHIQPRIYAYSLFENLPWLETVRFTHDMYIDDGSPNGGREKIETIFTRSADFADLRSSIARHVANTVTTQREATSLMGRMRGKDALKAVYKMRRGACNPYMCGSCAFRYQCGLKTFVEEARQTANQGKFVDTELSKLVDLDRKDKIDERIKEREEYVNWRKKQYIEERMAELREEAGMKPAEARQVASDEAKLLGESFDRLRYHTRGMFHDSVTRSGLMARSKLAHTILDPEAKARWMTTAVRRNIYEYSAQYVEGLAKSFKIGPEYAVDTVLDSVYKDREVAAHLDKTMMTNMEKRLKQEGLSLGKYGPEHPTLEYDASFAIRQYHKTIDSTVADTVNMALNERFVSHLIDVKSSVLREMGLDPKKMSLGAITGALVERGHLEKNPEKFLSMVARSETFGALMDRTRQGAPRFPVGSMILTGLLSYIAGANSVRGIVENKYNKLRFYLTHTEDQVDDGTHASAYSVSRRLLYSDFGSPLRTILKRSDLVNRHIRNFRDFFKDMVTIATGKSFSADRSFFQNLAESVGSSSATLTRRMINKSDEVLQNPQYLLAGGLIGAITFGLMPHIKTDRDIKREVRERNKRFKRMKKVQWSTSSPSEEPESALRMGYKEHSLIGSPFNAAKLPGILTTHWSDAVSLLSKVWSGIEKGAEKLLQSDRLLVVKDLAKDIAEKISQTGSPIRQKAAEFITKEMKDLQTDFAARYHNTYEKLQRVKSSIKVKASKFSMEQNRISPALGRAYGKAREEITEVIKKPSSTIGKIVNVSSETMSVLPSVPFQDRDRAHHLITRYEGGYGEEKAGREKRADVYDRNAGMVRPGPPEGSPRRHSAPTPKFVPDSTAPGYKPFTHAVFDREGSMVMASLDRSGMGSGFVASRVKGTVPASTQVPEINYMVVPDSIDPTGRGSRYSNEERLEALNRAYLSGRLSGGPTYYSSGNKCMERLKDLIP